MMRKRFLIGCIIAVAWGCQSTPNAATQQEVKQSVYGEAFDPTQAMEQSKLASLLSGSDSVEVKFKAEIVETCAKAGCWMTIKNNEGYPMYVFMKDHGFAVPTAGAGGHACIVHGKLYRDTLSVEIQKHFAEDAGMSEEQISAIQNPLPTLAVDATGVIIEGMDATKSEEGGAGDEKEHGH